MGVAVAAASALRDENPLTGFGEIVERLAGLVIEDNGADGDLDIEILAVSSMAIAAFAVASTFRTKRVVKTEFEKRVFVGVGSEIDIAAVAAISAAGTAFRNELLPAEGNATVPAVAGFDCDFGFVDEQFIRQPVSR